MILDAHVHLPSISETGSLQKSKDRLLGDMATNGVARSIVIPDNEKGSVIGDLDECLALLEDNPKLWLMGTIDILADGLPEAIRRLDGLFRQGKIVAVKIFPGHDPIYPTDARLDDVYRLCAAHHRPLVIHTGWNSGHPEAAAYNDPKYIVQVAEKHPGLEILVAHYFWPEVEYCYMVTRGHRSIYFDTSGLADPEVVAATGKGKIRDVLEMTLADDPGSVIFGTDYAMCSVREHVDLVRSLDVAPEVVEGIFAKNAIRLFHLDQ